MHFTETGLTGAFLVAIEPQQDHRGFFARTWCTSEFSQAGLPSEFVQASVSYNARRGTIRGMHMQLPPSQEGKLVRCSSGRIYDVIVDLRPASPTYLNCFGIELTSKSHQALYIPPAMLHGFQTLEDETEVFYQMTDFYAPELSYGARWNDPAFNIQWPIESELTLSERDSLQCDFDREAYEARLVTLSETSA